ncbi:MAG: AsmA-like C-terminal region-containing protein [Myxococcota bacterium]
MRRKLLWGTFAVLVAVGLAVLMLPRWLSGDLSRERLEAILSEALDRTVTIESVELAEDAPVVELRGVRVAQPDGLEDPEQRPLLHAARVRLEASVEDLLEGHVIGLASVEDVTVVVLERGGETSVHGLGRRRKPAGETKPKRSDRTLDLELELQSASVHYVDLDREEAVALDEIDLRAHLGQRSGNEGVERDALATLNAASLTLHDIEFTQLMAQVRLRDRALEVVRVQATVGEGTLSGHAKLLPPEDGKSRDWSVSLDLADTNLDGPLRDIAALTAPWIVRATGADGAATTGKLSAHIEAEGHGLRLRSILPSLRGSASLRLRDVVVPPGTMLADLATMVGRAEGRWEVGNVEVELDVADSWISPQTIKLGELEPKIKGRISIEGKLDLNVDLFPLVGLFGGGVYETVARTTTRLPVRITGTVHEPRLAPPRIRDVAAGLLGGAVRRALSSKSEDPKAPVEPTPEQAPAP